MVALFVQTLLLMAAAYFIGAAVACIVRRSLHTRQPVAAGVERRVDPLPEIQSRVSGAERFGRSGGSEAAPITVPAGMPGQPPITLPAGGAPARASAITVPVVEHVPAQDLKRIRRIDARLEGELNKLGVLRYDHIAGWMHADIERIGKALGLAGRISRENWIEQAQVLAKGGETHYAARLARGESANAWPTPDEGEPRRVVAAAPSVPPATPQVSTGGAAGVVAQIATAAVASPVQAAPVPSSEPPRVSERAAFAMRRTEPASPPPPVAAPEPVPPDLPPAVAIRPPAATPQDNLRRIGQIDEAAERLLAAQGVSRYSQIAHWSPADIARFDALLGGTGRIGRENWVEQAQILSRDGDTAYSREYDRRAAGSEEANPGGETSRQPRMDFAGMRSVRSEAYQARDAAAQAGPRAGYQAARSAAVEDLKRIRGIGVLIEKRLNSMGVLNYEQIANWTAADIARVSQSLDFKGRIERENWVEQARILASGGATEFSRRVDRGELETSRYRP